MKKPAICAVIANKDLAAIREVEPLADLFEVRIDLIGDGWEEIARELKKPWIACNRLRQEGGSWRGTEARRKEELLKAVGLGAETVDLELATTNLENMVSLVKKGAKCLLSFHEMEKTPPIESLREIVKRQMAAGADICKVVTTARAFEDNLSLLGLLSEFPETKMVAFAMGQMGLVSRVLSPLVGAEFTYAAISSGAESAPGQLTAAQLHSLYRMVSQ